ncbi:MAG: hypothetical protein AAGG57_18635 [Pseudomonadota bacterium]
MAFAKAAFGTGEWASYHLEGYIFVALIYRGFIFSLGQYGDYLTGRMAIFEQ